jgi:hypothetical protein
MHALDVRYRKLAAHVCVLGAPQLQLSPPQEIFAILALSYENANLFVADGADIFTYIYMRTRMYAHTYTHVSGSFTHTYTCAHIYTYTHIHIYTHVYKPWEEPARQYTYMHTPWLGTLRA